MRYWILLFSLILFGIGCDIKHTAIDSCIEFCVAHDGVDRLDPSAFHNVWCFCEDGEFTVLHTETGK